MRRVKMRAIFAVIAAGLLAAVIGAGVVGAEPTNQRAKELYERAQQRRAAAAEAFAKAENGRLPARVVFRSPVALERFNQIAERQGLKVERFRLRVVEEDGTEAIIGGVPDANGRINRADLDRFVEVHQSKKPVALWVEGVFDATVEVDQAAYEHLEAQPDVFLVDVTPEQDDTATLFDEMLDAGMVE